MSKTMKCAPDECEFWDDEDGVCTAFECFGLGFLDGCPPLPCEESESDQDE